MKRSSTFLRCMPHVCGVFRSSAVLLAPTGAGRSRVSAVRVEPTTTTTIKSAPPSPSSSTTQALLKKWTSTIANKTATATTASSSSTFVQPQPRGKNTTTKNHHHKKESIVGTAEEKREEEEVEESSASSSSTAALVASGALTNPFRGLHTEMLRSYRLDQLLSDATCDDAIIARQEKKSTAFSFLKWKAGLPFYEGHWGSSGELAQQVTSLMDATPLTTSLMATTSASAKLKNKKKSNRASSSEATNHNSKGEEDEDEEANRLGRPLAGHTLFNNDLGLHNPLVQISYPLILAQRLLLFPDHLRHFHTVCGRENVPCDFFADIDLPDETPAAGEKILLEVLNYLEVRLPGIGFTDPFFLILANEEASPDKVSYHVHARSMSHCKAAYLTALGVDVATEVSAIRAQRRRVNVLEEDDAEADQYENLDDVVQAVTGERGLSAKERKKRLRAARRMITFQDYRTVKLIADEVNQTLGRTVIDDNCYRPNGMLRCAFNSKIASAASLSSSPSPVTRKRLMPLITAKDKALQAKLSDMEKVLRRLSDPEILEMTFCNRFIDSPSITKEMEKHAKGLVALDSHAHAGSAAKLRSEMVLKAAGKSFFKLIRPRHVLGPQAAQAVEYDPYGNVVSPFFTETAKWRRYKTAIQKVHLLPPRAAENHDVWVRVGLALHNFSNEDHVFDEWVRFSLKCPQKYSREVCRKKWMQFERNPDALNWRRGYNYLTSTVWKMF